MKTVFKDSRSSFFCIVLVLILLADWAVCGSEEPRDNSSLDELERPSPALGQTVANAIHQALSDPYLIPLEEFSLFLQKDPDCTEISVALMSKWSTDNEFPTGFVYDFAMDSWQIDHPVSPWVLEAVEELLHVSARNRPESISPLIKNLEANGAVWWVGFLFYPMNDKQPFQAAGVFFSMSEYLGKHLPRSVDKVAARSRFPIVPFEQNLPVDLDKPDGHIAFRILDSKGELFFQRGRSFEPGKMIYAESKYYDQTVVCMQKGWDLQVFSRNAGIDQKTETKPVCILQISLTAIGCLILILIWTRVNRLRNKS